MRPVPETDLCSVATGDTDTRAHPKDNESMSIRYRIKRTIKTVFLILTAPAYVIFRLLSIVGDPDTVFQSFSQAMSLVPGKIGVYIRASFYRLACPDTSDEIVVGFLTVLSHRDITIGPGAYIGSQCNIGKCVIGRDALVGSGVHILSGARQHEFNRIDKPIQKQGGTYEKITIGEDCWLGNGSLIMASLAAHCIVAAGSIVTKPTQRGDIVAGVPARIIRNRFGSDNNVASQGDV
jgi:acetyltransferase-like isoleucine patch superfamily enzyme